MVAATRSSTNLVVNAEAFPRTYAPSRETHGTMRQVAGTVETAVADAASAVYVLCKLPAEACVTSIKLFHDAVTSVTDANVGLYTGDSSSNLTDADENCYADAVDLSSASTTGTEVAFEVRDVANMGNTVWEDAGDTQGDFREYYLCITSISDPGGANTISYVVTYALD